MKCAAELSLFKNKNTPTYVKLLPLLEGFDTFSYIVSLRRDIVIVTILIREVILFWHQKMIIGRNGDMTSA